MTKLTIDQALQKAVEAHKAGQVQDANRLYAAILKAQPKHPDANHNLGVLAVGVGKANEALPFLKTALEVNPNIAQFWLSYIDAIIKLDRINDAKAVLDQAKSKGAKGDDFDKLDQWLQKTIKAHLEADKIADVTQPQQTNILDSLKLNHALKLAKKNESVGALQEAKRIYQDVLSRFPKNKRAKDGLKKLAYGPNDNISKYQNPPKDQVKGLINLYNQGQLEQAINLANTLIEKFHDSATLLNIQGAILKGLGQLDLSLDAYKKALAIKPDHAEAYNNIGVTLQEQGKLEEAIEAYKKALTIKPDYAEAYNNIGVTLQEQGKLKEAIEAYKKALAIKPDYAEAYFNMGNALRVQGKLEEVIEAHSKALSIKPEYAEAYNNMGNALKEQGKLEEAIEAYRKALKIKPDYDEAYNNMGNALQDQGKLEEAIEAYNKALEIKPDHAEAYYNMGITFKTQGKLEEAIEAYNKALEIKPNNAETYYNMGNALKEHGKLEEAIEAYNKALEIKPDYACAQHLVSSLTGKKTTSAPKQYVESLFDGYAKKFEANLVNELEYRTPKLIKEIINANESGQSLGAILDLGCGTGLFGLEINAFCSKLEGIDLSKEMLRLANQKNIYDELSHIGIVEYLSNMPLDFDYYVAADVFVYLGELNEVFRLIKTRNRRSGKLVFSTEHTENDGYHLLETGRYSHSKSYIESLCKKFGFNLSHFSKNKLRKEHGYFLTGGIYVLDF